MLKKDKLPSPVVPNNLGLTHPTGAASLASIFAGGLARHQAGGLADAERIYNHILARQPDHFDSRQLLGAIFLQRGQYAEALHHVELALKKKPDNVLFSI